MFVGRKKELAELKRAYSRAGIGIFVIGGPSGAGKTALIEEFCKDKDNIFFTASHESGRANLKRFSAAILEHYKDMKRKPFVFWNNAFKYIRDMQQSTSEWDFKNSSDDDSEKSARIIVVLEEFDELANRDSVFMDMLRSCIDSELMDSNILLIISSQDTKFLQRNFLAEGTPLFHRTIGSMILDKFTLTDEAVAEITEHTVTQTPAVHSMKIVKFSADEVILSEGESSPCMYKIIAGKAVLYFGYGTDDEYVIGTLKEGQSFGEYSMLTGKPGIYTAVAFTDLLVLRIEQEDFTNFIEMNAANSVEIMRNMANMINVLKANIDMLRGESGSQA